MNNLIRVIFGIPPDDQQGPRVGNDSPNEWRNNFNGNFSGSDGNDDDYDNDVDGDDNNMRINPGGFGGGGRGGMGFFGFPIFSDPFEIHKYFESLADEMHKKFELFGFHNGPSIIWEDGRGGFSPETPEELPNNSENLRNSYLKSPNCDNGKCIVKPDVALDGQINPEDIDNYLKLVPGPSRDSQIIQQSPPQVYSKSVFIRTIRRPDGSVETVKKVCDHTGKEEITTTITQPNETQTQIEPIQPTDDVSGMSIFRKFFPF